MDFQEFIKDPKVPSWVRTHPIFKDITSADKIFPLIGLSNFQEDVSLNVDDSFYRVVRAVVSSIWGQLENAHYTLSQTIMSGQGWDGHKYIKITEAQKKNLTSHLHLLKQGYMDLASSHYPKYVEQQKTDKKLSLIKDIAYADGKLFAKKGERLFKVYGKFATLIEGLFKLVKLEEMQSFKDYSTANFSGKMQVIFSAADKEGAWDILTMSMRGITSCQSWTGQYHKATIGSMLDPFTGIIYLTTGASGEHGSKMLRRCVVRFVVNSETRQPAIYLEFMYPNYYEPALKVFREVIATKISKKIPIIDWKDAGLHKYYVPYSESTKALLKHSIDPKCANTANKYNQMTILPYRDTYIEYKVKKDKDDVYQQQIDTHIASFKSGLSNLIFSKSKHPAPFLNSLNDVLLKALDSKLIAPISKDDCADSKSYMRKIYMSYFSHKQQFIKALKEELAKQPSLAKSFTTELKKKQVLLEPFFAGAKKAPKGQAKTKKAITSKASKKTSSKDVLALIDKDFVPLFDKEIKSRWKSLFITSELQKTNKVANAKN